MSKKSELSISRAEVKRLVKNWRALLDIMPQMVLLVREDFVVEYLNHRARELVGDIRGQRCIDALCNTHELCQTTCPVRCALSGECHASGMVETEVGEMAVEYTAVPFAGYSGDNLALVLMHDISERKVHERELRAFNTDIEAILRRKIDELKESEVIRRQLARQVNVLKRKMGDPGQADGMVGSSRKMRELRDMIEQVANSDATILITGESGTGKELVANMIRQLSSRRDKPFLKVNCNTINDNLLESDLFGYEKGAFTGAANRKLGKFEIVDGGTIFLDEIGDISPRMQASLLRVLQNGDFIRVGGNKPIKVDVRIIAATNVDLSKAVQDGEFRLDLYYRLNIIKIALPPLRERKEDIVELASYFVKRYRDAFKKEIDFLPSTIIDKLLEHDWPGNVRELENVMQRAVLMAKNNVITEQELIFDDAPAAGKGDYFNKLVGQVSSKSLKDILASVESDLILHALKEHEGNVVQAARGLGVGKTALYEKMKKHGISAKALK